MRIVSLCPSTTETLIDFGLAESLVGITKFCIHPQDVVARLERVGGTKNPKIERILALQPDLVLMNEEENRKEDHEQLARSVRVEVSFPKTLDEVPDHLRWLGELVETEVSAEQRARALEHEIESLRARRDENPSASFRFAYLIWRNPWMGAGPNTYVDDLFGRAGGHNVFGADGGRYPSVELEALSRLRADVIFLPDEPFPFDRRHVPEVREACRGAEIELISGDDCCWHGVRSLRGARLAQALFERFARPRTR